MSSDALSWILLLSLLAGECHTAGQLVYRSECCRDPDSIPDVAKKSVDFIEKYGFQAEIHEVVTEDGYIVTLHRVLPKFECPGRPAVLLQHGIAGSSMLWLMNLDKSFPFMLSDIGFDVWLADSRGNSYSPKHAVLSRKDPRYWRFSFHEQGLYDLSAAVDYILSVTSTEKLFYVGHSRGTSMAVALLSSRPEYNDKFHLVTLFAPVVYLKHTANPILSGFFSNPLLYSVEPLLKSLGLYIVPGSSNEVSHLREVVCNQTQLTCINLVFAFGGYDYELLNKSMIPVYMSHYPEGGALQEFAHFAQIGITDKFRAFDYGYKTNLEVYNAPEPPFYDLSKITAPISLHHGDGDLLVRPKDLEHLSRQLSSVVASVRVPFKLFSHSDFIWATKADVYLYEPTIRLMSRYRPDGGLCS